MRHSYKITTFILSIITIISFACYLNAAGLTVPADYKVDVIADEFDIAGDITNAGTLQITEGSIELDGNWTNTGTFDAGTSGTVEFTGSTAATITGDNTFFDFTCTEAGKQLSFEAGKTQTISGTWTLTGASGDLVALRSTVADSQWNVNPATTNISFVDVKDSNNLSGAVIDPSSSADSGNNSNWFSAVEVTTTTTTTIIADSTTTTIAATTTTTLTSDTTTTLASTTTTITDDLLTTTTVVPVTTTTLPGSESAPTAEFTSDVIGGFVPFDVTFTDLSTGNPASWQWDFGDGDISSEQNPTHTYNFAGDFTVTLTVTNGNGSDTEIKTGLISSDPPSNCTASFNADKTSGFAPLEVQFTDISTGNPVSWQWEFGDGDISSEQNPVHTYQTAGIFSVTLTISGSCGIDVDTRTNLIIVGSVSGPVAEFNGNPGAGFAPLDVEFENLSTGDPTSFAWEFGDGGSSSDENPNHTYNNSGIYTPSLLVSNANGADLEIKTNLINVDSGGELPAPDFTANPLVGPEPLNVQFTDESTGNIDSWGWDFGDGVTSSLQNPVHEYINEGFYNVRLTISGSDGEASEKKADFIEILAPGEDVVAVFDASPQTGNAPFTVHFFDNSNGEVSDYIWDFGDSEVSTEQNPVHTYETLGSYDVTLVIFTDDGRGEKLEEGFITVEEGEAPTAGFAADDNSGEDNDRGEDGNDDGDDEDNPGQGGGRDKNFTVQFNDLSSSPDDEILEREWDFGDGAKSADKDPEHTYTGNDGDAFTVSLSVLNSDGFDTLTKPSFISIASSVGPGFVAGNVTDEKTGDVIEGVECCVESAEGERVACADTTKDGNYFLQVAPDEYVFTANKDGFSGFSKDIEVEESETITVNVELGTGRDGDDDDDDSRGKSFTFNCDQSMERGLILGLETLTLEKGETENCTLKLTDHESGKTVTIGTLLRDGFRSAIEIASESGVTDENGELEITIKAVKKGRDWAAWAVPNEDNVFEFSKKTYDAGLAWGMFVKVK